MTLDELASNAEARVAATGRRAHHPRVLRQTCHVERYTLVHALTAQPARRRYRTLYDVTPTKHAIEVTRDA